MIRKLTFAAVVAALLALLVAALTPGEAQQRAAPSTQYSDASAVVPAPAVSPRHDAGMRIIHVPQGEAVAAIDPGEPAVEEEAAPPRRPLKRAVPRRVLPPADAPKRTMLKPPAANSLTPIRPTPRWRGIEKFTEPPKPVAVAPIPPDSVVAPIPQEAGVPDSDSTIDDDTPPPAD